MDGLAAKAELLRGLHHGPEILVLPNAWDAASARIFEDAGFPALATTSAGIAASLGYPDGERVARDEMLQVVRRIARAVAIPVTADLEAGYGPTIPDAEATARGLLEAGAVGLNFEDSHGITLVDPAVHAERIRAIRRVGDGAGVPIVINARTDVYLAQVGAPETRFDEAVRRANIYLGAGADCVFIPGGFDGETIGRLVQAVSGPINIILFPGMPSIPELQRLGVARVSTGSGPMRAALGFTRRLAQELKQHGTYSAFAEGIPYAEVNRLMGR